MEFWMRNGPGNQKPCEPRTSSAGGATIWITGLPAAGKTSLACALERDLTASGCPTALLDGDVLRGQRFNDLGFDRASRAEMVRRVAQLACEQVEVGVIAIVALVSPYAADRRAARFLHTERGFQFVEIFLDTPVAVCRQRDPKGLYARAVRGELAALTGVDDPYEPPDHPELHLRVQPLHLSVDAALATLAKLGVLRLPAPARLHPLGGT
jgi:bifunctional enzyme CysN/CysC